MNIILSPQRRDDTLVLSKSGDVLTINGTEYDTTTDDSDTWLIKVDGDDVTVLFPHGKDASEAQRFPSVIADIADGPVILP